MTLLLYIILLPLVLLGLALMVYCFYELERLADSDRSRKP